MKLTKRELILLIVVLIAGISFLFFNYVYTPLNNDVKELEEQYNLLLEDEEKAKNLSIKIKALEKELIEIEESTEGVYDGMVELWDQAEILVYIEDLMEDLCDRFTINSYTPVDVVSIRSADIDLSIETNYENLHKILDRLEDGEYYCSIESINIASSLSDGEPDNTEPMDLSVSFTIRFYAKGQSSDYPTEYDFMKGKFDKSNIFYK